MSGIDRKNGGRMSDPDAVAQRVTAFVRKRRERVATRWFDPLVLLSTVSRWASSRHATVSWPDPVTELAVRPALATDEIWVDFVADIGDGLDATKTIAHLFAKPFLHAQGVAEGTPRGSILVLGGDLVYPHPSVRAYKDKTLTPILAAYQAAYQEAGARTDGPTVLAVPGNHDWLDGLGAFKKVFVTPQDQHYGDVVLQTPQVRSYFSTPLNGKWWLWGLDLHADGTMDDEQLGYFWNEASGLKADDGVIVCTPKPGWISDAFDEPTAARALGEIEYMIRSRGAEVRLTLSGDYHAWSRYEAADGAQRVTSAGGAYLDGTHHFPTNAAGGRYTLASTSLIERDGVTGLYPSPLESRRASRNFARILWRNGPWFPLAVGVLYALLAQFLQSAPTNRRVIAAILGFGVCALVTMRLSFRSTFAAILHCALQFAFVAVLLRLWPHVPSPWLVVATIGAVAGPLLLGLVFFASDRLFRINTFALFAGQRIERYRTFIRLRVTQEDVVVHSYAVDTICRRWNGATPVHDRAPTAKLIDLVVVHRERTVPYAGVGLNCSVTDTLPIFPSALQAGDVLFFHADSPLGAAIRGLDLGDYTHVGLVVNASKEMWPGVRGLRKTFRVLRRRRGGVGKNVIVLDLDSNVAVTVPELLSEHRHGTDFHVDVRRVATLPDAGWLRDEAARASHARFDTKRMLRGGTENAGVLSGGESEATRSARHALVDAVTRSRTIFLAERSLVQRSIDLGRNVAREPDIYLRFWPAYVLMCLFQGLPFKRKKSHRLVCSTFVARCFTGELGDSPNAGLLGPFPAQIKEHAELRLHQDSALGRCEVARRASAGLTLDGGTPAVEQLRRTAGMRSLHWNSMLEESAASLYDFTVRSGVTLGPNMLFDAPGFEPEVYRLVREPKRARA